jgi:hypothetical protein
MKRALIAISALAFGACATKDEPAPQEARQNFESIAAPTPADVALKIKADSDGQNVTVKKGTKAAVELVGTPTAGLLWVAKKVPPFLKPAGEYGGPTSTAQLQEGFAGGNHWEAFLFDVTGTGEGELRFEQRSAFGGDDTEPPSNAFSVYVFAEE